MGGFWVWISGGKKIITIFVGKINLQNDLFRQLFYHGSSGWFSVKVRGQKYSLDERLSPEPEVG